VTKHKLALAALKDRMPNLPKVEEVREKADKVKVDLHEIEMLKKEVEVLTSRIKFKKEQPSMQAALQQEEKISEIKRLIQDYKMTYNKLQLEKQEQEKETRR
jgi:hypothetical protein